MKSFLVAAAIVASCLGAIAHADPEHPVSTLRVIGNAVIAARPDRAQIDLGVVTQSPEASVAAAENASHLQSTLAALHRVLGARADIRTISYDLVPSYRPEPAAEPTIIGYIASNIVRVTIDDLAKVGPVIDAATQSGANRVRDIRLTLRDPQAAQNQALRQAALQARTEADTLASALGVKIVRILSVEESGSPVRPIRPLAFARVAVAAAPTPVEAGTVDVSATVTLTVEVGT